MQREKIQSGRKKDKRFEGEGGAGVLRLQRGGQIDQWMYTSWRSPRRKSQYWKVWDLQKKQGGSSRIKSCKEFRI